MRIVIDLDEAGARRGFEKGAVIVRIEVPDACV
jgi:hypothetical protein